VRRVAHPVNLLIVKAKLDINYLATLIEAPAGGFRRAPL